MPKLGDEKRKEIITLVKQMRKDDVGWDTIMGDQRVKGLVQLSTLKNWVGEGGEAAPAKPRRGGGKVSDAQRLKEALEENARLQALVSDILLGKVKLQRA